jgi:mono/diheme cytochrome c family protein
MRNASLVACLAIVLCACSKAPAPAEPATPRPVAAIPKGDPVEGKRIAMHVGCTGCHEPDGRGGGMDITTPEGDRLVAANLTQRRKLYDDAGLARLLREGKTHDGHRPFGMPIYMFQHLSDREVRDLTAWLRGLPDVDNPGLGQNKMSDKTLKQIADGTFPWDADDKPDPGNVPPTERPTETLALGRHIALTSCSECHGRDLTGWEGDTTPSLVIVNKAYTPEHFARLMKTGVAANGKDTRTGFMSSVARHRFAVLTDAEVAALKQYLDSR